MSDQVTTFSQTDKFAKDLRKYSKKYRSLPDDIESFKSALRVAHFSRDVSCEDLGIFPVSNPDVPPGFFIAKKFACKSLRGSGCRSGFRVVYHLNDSRFEFCFIELYHKNKKSIEDFERLKQFLS